MTATDHEEKTFEWIWIVYRLLKEYAFYIRN